MYSGVEEQSFQPNFETRNDELLRGIWYVDDKQGRSQVLAGGGLSQVDSQGPNQKQGGLDKKEEGGGWG